METRNRFTLDIIGIGIIIFVVLACFVLLWLIKDDPTRIRGSIYNEDDGGSSLFYNWLGQQGYQTGTIQSLNGLNNLPNETVFILNTQGEYPFQELYAFDSWIRNGGTAVIAQESNQASDLTTYFNTSIRWIWPTVNNAELKLPLLNWPNFVDSPNLRANHKVNIQCGRAAIHIGTCARPILTSFGYGNGQIYFISTVHPFTNRGLENGANANLVENLVRNTAGRSGIIAFDEGHRQGSLFWFLSSPVGWAIFLVLLCLFLYILWRSLYSRSAQSEVERTLQVSEIQESVQYLNKVAQAEKNLHGSNAVKEHYWLRLKRILCQRFRLDPAMPDKEFMDAMKPHLDETDMAQLISLHIREERDPLTDDLALRTWTESMIQLTEKYQPATRQVY